MTEANIRLRRSVLFMPGANARALEKARSLPCDAVIFDLEDAVAPEAKSDARARVAAAVRAGGYGRREVIVRVNALSTEWGHDDVAAFAGLGIDAMLFPKVESAAEVGAIVATLDAAGGGSLPVWAMVETPRAVLHCEAIAAAHPRLAALVLGTSDLVASLRGRHTSDRSSVLTALSLCVLAARATDRCVLDGVHLDFRNLADLQRICEQARDLGFDGKTLIHPDQIAVANAVFAPGEQEVERARRIIDAHRQAVAAGRGVVVLDGQLIENLHVRDAERVLALHAAAVA